jgi:DHA1 family bicyclomycin/chloramphenicol resistance-like MFS transporter
MTAINPNGNGAASPAAQHGGGLGAPLMVALALLAAISPFSTDFCLPAFPRIAAEFGVGASSVQLCLTAVLMGGAVGQLVFGPLSDRFGRMAPLLGGVVLCAAASAAAALAPSLRFLTSAQFIQGFGGATGMVISRAIIADLTTDRIQAARANNIVMAVFGIAPIVAPWIGSLLTDPIGWRGILWTTFAIVVFTFLYVLLVVRESHPASRRCAHRAASLEAGEAPLKALATRGFIGNALIYCAAFGVLMSFISASPFLFQTVIGLSVRKYGLIYAGITLLQTVSCAIAAKLVGRFSPGQQLRFGAVIIFLASVVLLALKLAAVPPIWLLLPIAAAIACVGFTMGNSAAAAISSAPRAAGMGSALMGALQFVAGGLAAPLVGLGGAASTTPLVAMMLVCSALALIAFHLTWKKAEIGAPVVAA